MAISAMCKVNFWNSLRVERNIRYRDLVELFGGSVGNWGGFFSGELMPSDTYIEKLCDLFDVEFGKGKAEFMKAHKVWVSEHHSCERKASTGKSDTNRRKGCKRKEKVAVNDYDTITIEEPSMGNDFNERVNTFRADIYGKVSFEVYDKCMNILNAVTMTDVAYKSVIEVLYGNLTFSEYDAVIGAIKRE